MQSKNYYNYWNLKLQKQGYESCFIKKTRPIYWENIPENELKYEDEIDGISIFYNKEKFECIDLKKFQISQYFKEEFQNNYDLKLNHMQINNIFNTRNQVALIMVLKHKLTNQIFIVANTHLYWKLNDIKLLQVMVLLEALGKFKSKYPGAKILFSGDFNSQPNSSVYNFLQNDKINTMDPDISKYLIEKTKKFIINPVEIPNNILEQIIKNDKSNELFTCYTQHLFGIFDYIWFNDKDFQLLKMLSGVDQNYLSQIKGLPNEEFPSDHIPLVAEFGIKI
ncbi:Glucose-repressible alcohol dehydrogenase transcriptional effector [Wickerhamomyces ciferrii]|uniref:Glucose-repressible alcohol dehydrogenase transcriptional effector n=1 Tax=Wickerhamomyces ciferrii (strain ATCC 14091 / BCRC 22168 / CBS 111 / JCM 3599 / NBRC 0793 / NRRL Y-1031 F-60-10) TaxID=1206466 RepID=K0L0Y9_WICCF|nr:Glucose-repressible alcohol dehydrogenase transcriptional effector [Wickerhamomyces ciferrii]CCH47118.1 Glucose-repressible alcohol dehydrogenase transcriptional effector [Wickerhamomyces ciferrii]